MKKLFVLLFVVFCLVFTLTSCVTETSFTSSGTSFSGRLGSGIVYQTSSGIDVGTTFDFSTIFRNAEDPFILDTGILFGYKNVDFITGVRFNEGQYQTTFFELGYNFYSHEKTVMPGLMIFVETTTQKEFSFGLRITFNYANHDHNYLVKDSCHSVCSGCKGTLTYHNYVLKEQEAATLMNSGYKCFRCTKCGSTYTEHLPARYTVCIGDDYEDVLSWCEYKCKYKGYHYEINTTITKYGTSYDIFVYKNSKKYDRLYYFSTNSSGKVDYINK